MSSEKMTSTEKRAVISLSSIMGLRMIGLFMVLPVFTLYANQLEGATPILIGLSLGIYGLTQAFFQIPFGALSDHYGRKPLILFGLLLFAAGSCMAAMAHSIIFMIIGRALQGAGAVGSTTLAMLADLTREEQRTKSMAIAGISIGFSFSLAMLLGPLLTTWLPVNNLFYLAVLFSLCAIVVLYTSVPSPSILRWQRDTQPELKSFLRLLLDPGLAKLNGGIFILHTIFTASFVIIPISMTHLTGFSAKQQWLLYLPTLLIAFIITLIIIGIAEKKHRIKLGFVISILFLAVSEFLFWLASTNLYFSLFALCLFFTGFSSLEAFLPSLISRIAPLEKKGSALGIYSSAQFLGIFVGGVFGGWLYGNFSFSGVYTFCILLSFFWLALALLMQSPGQFVTQVWRLTNTQINWDMVAEKLHAIPGMLEVTFIVEDGIAYLKMERGTVKHPDFIRLKKHTIKSLS